MRRPGLGRGSRHQPADSLLRVTRRRRNTQLAHRQHHPTGSCAAFDMLAQGALRSQRKLLGTRHLHTARQSLLSQAKSPDCTRCLKVSRRDEICAVLLIRALELRDPNCQTQEASTDCQNVGGSKAAIRPRGESNAMGLSICADRASGFGKRRSYSRSIADLCSTRLSPRRRRNRRSSDQTSVGAGFHSAHQHFASTRGASTQRISSLSTAQGREDRA